MVFERRYNRDIKSTAAHFKGNYAQIYQWVKKYELNGEDGLSDRRGKRKQEDELTEVEILQRKLKQSETEKEEFKKKYELLKKAEQIETIINEPESRREWMLKYFTEACVHLKRPQRRFHFG